MKQRGKWTLYLAGAIIFVLLLRSFLFTPYTIPSTGMEDTLLQGDRILVNKWSYGLRFPLMSVFSYHRWMERPVRARDIVVFNNPADYDKPSIDRKEIFISRCIGIPGDTLKVDSLFNVSSWEKAGPDRKALFHYPKAKEGELAKLLKELSIDVPSPIDGNNDMHIRPFTRYEYYLLEQALGAKIYIRLLNELEVAKARNLIVPQKGLAIDINPWNATLYRNTIVLHEHKHADVKEGVLYVDGQAVSSYTFTKDYYWMASDNLINYADSRLFGFVPHDHLIGRAMFIWLSKKPDGNPLSGYRWSRTFHSIK